MALSVCGRVDEAEAAYGWLAATQLGDGGWFNYYLGDRVKDARIDTNVCAYVATGRLAPLLRDGATTRSSHGTSRWSSAALDFVLRCQLADGTIRWSVDATGAPSPTRCSPGSSSIFHALRCGVAAAEELGTRAARLGARRGPARPRGRAPPGPFAPKNEYAMDWYYPVLCGALEGDAAATGGSTRGCATFVIEGLGVRCVSTNDWVTAAETAECAMALDALGRRDEALTRARPDRGAPARGRLVLHRASPTRSCTTFPGGRDDLVHRGGGRARRRRAQLDDAGRGALPRRAARPGARPAPRAGAAARRQPPAPPR